MLKIGDVIRVPAGRNAGLAIVLDPGISGDTDPRPTVLTAERQVRRLSVLDFPSPVEAIEHLRIPKSFNARSPQSRRDLAATIRARVPDHERPRRGKAERGGDDAEIARLRAAIRQHPCHGCEEREDHARWGERYHRLLRETEQIRQRAESRTHTIAREFDRVCEVLDVLGYLDGDTVTPAGQRLARIYSELDLVAAECLRGRTLGGPGAGGAGRVRVDARLRVPTRGRRRRPAAASGPRARRTGRHGAHLEPPRRARAGPPAVVPARAGPRLRLGSLALGDRRAPGDGAVRGRARGRGLRALDAPAVRPARPDRRPQPMGRCAHRRSQRASCSDAGSSPTRPSPEAGPRQDVEQPVERGVEAPALD